LRNREAPASGQVAGTLAYMAPEVLMDEPANELSDLYSFGILAYELLAGRLPFEDSSAGRLMAAILTIVPDFEPVAAPPPRRRVLERLLEKSASARPQDAASVARELAAAAELPVLAEREVIRESYLQAASFVARDRELAALTQALNEACALRGGGWLVGGESG